MFELKKGLKLRLYNDSEETTFCTNHKYWLEIMEEGEEEGFYIKLTKTEYECLCWFTVVEE